MEVERATVAASYASNLLYSLQCIYPKLPAQLGLPALTVTSQPSQVALSAVERLLCEAGRWVGDQALGLTVGTSDSFTLWPALAAMTEAPTLRAAIEVLQRAESAVEGVVYPLVERGRLATLSCQVAFDSPVLVRFHAEYVFVKLLCLFRELQPRLPARAHRVSLQYARPRPRARHAAVFGSPVLFGQSENALTFPSSLLDLPRQPAAGATAVEATEGPTVERARGLALPVRQLLRARRVLESVDSQEVAAALSVTPRVLRRRLTSEGTSLSELLDEEKRRRACEQLLAGATLEDITASTGFASVNTFARAFRRWTGLTPSEFARRRVAGFSRAPTTALAMFARASEAAQRPTSFSFEQHA